MYLACKKQNRIKKIQKVKLKNFLLLHDKT